MSSSSSSIPGSAHLNLSLGGIVLLGGAYGYFSKGSKASLIAGIAFGTLYISSGYIIAKTPDRMYEGHVLGTCTSAMLALAMGQRYMSTNKFMPSGLLAILGATAFAYNMKKTIDWSDNGSKSA